MDTDSLQKENELLKEKIKELEMSLRLHQQLLDENARLKNDLESSEAERAKLQAHIEELRQTLTASKERVAELEKSLSECKLDVKRHVDAHDALKKENASLNDRIRVLENKNNRLQLDMTGLKNELDQVKSDRTADRDRLQEMSEKIMDLEAREKHATKSRGDILIGQVGYNFLHYLWHDVLKRGDQCPMTWPTMRDMIDKSEKDAIREEAREIYKSRNNATAYGILVRTLNDECFEARRDSAHSNKACDGTVATPDQVREFIVARHSPDLEALFNRLTAVRGQNRPFLLDKIA